MGLVTPLPVHSHPGSPAPHETSVPHSPVLLSPSVLVDRRVAVLHRQPLALDLLSATLRDWQLDVVAVPTVAQLEDWATHAGPAVFASLLCVCVDLPSIVASANDSAPPPTPHSAAAGAGALSSADPSASPVVGGVPLPSSWLLLSRVHSACQSAGVPLVLLVPLGSQRRNFVTLADTVLTHPVKAQHLLQMLLQQVQKREQRENKAARESNMSLAAATPLQPHTQQQQQQQQQPQAQQPLTPFSSLPPAPAASREVTAVSGVPQLAPVVVGSTPPVPLSVSILPSLPPAPVLQSPSVSAAAAAAGILLSGNSSPFAPSGSAAAGSSSSSSVGVVDASPLNLSSPSPSHSHLSERFPVSSYGGFAKSHLLPNGAPLRILVAEDNSVNQRIISKVLLRLGYLSSDFRLTADGQSAAEEIQRCNAYGTAPDGTHTPPQQPYNAVLMDLQMPICDGCQSTVLIRSTANLQQPYIIALTANAMEGDAAHCIASGMEAYMAKPVQVQVLCGALHAAWEAQGGGRTPAANHTPRA